MGIDYAMATLPYSILSIQDYDLSDAIRVNLNEYIGNCYEDWGDYESDEPFFLCDWEADKDYKSIGDSIKERTITAYALNKDGKTVYFAQEGSKVSGWTYWSIGSYERETLEQFAKDLQLADPEIVENYVFFLIW